MQLAGFDARAFLADTWQRRPLLLKNPWRAWRNPLTPEELAGLACEPDVESRLVLQRPRKGWQLEHGPLAETRFAKLPTSHWTLLVQAVDQWVPEVRALLEPFRFIPDWRIDDVMVSYAADGGGVGPHFDQYDVLLIQGLGRRRWQVGERCDHTTVLLPDQPLRLLREFNPLQEWVLEPGDVLYLPPRYAHNGVALGDDCMTYSVGFRAPGRAELISHWCDHVLTGLNDDDRYTDPPDQRPAVAGEIPAEALTRLRQMAMEMLDDTAQFRRWFGGYATTRKYPELDTRPDAPLTAARLRQRLQRGAQLYKHPAARLAFIPGKKAAQLFADGREFACETKLARQLCRADHFGIECADNDARLETLLALYNHGTLSFEK